VGIRAFQCKIVFGGNDPGIGSQSQLLNGNDFGVGFPPNMLDILLKS